jgi:hypothetical protein
MAPARTGAIVALQQFDRVKELSRSFHDAEDLGKIPPRAGCILCSAGCIVRNTHGCDGDAKRPKSDDWLEWRIEMCPGQPCSRGRANRIYASRWRLLGTGGFD